MRAFDSPALGKATAIAAFLAVVAVGCSSSHSTASGPSAEPATSTTRPLATGAKPARVAPSVSPVVAALALAHRVVNAAVLPPGARPYAGPVPPLLRGPFETPSGSNLVRANRVWTVPGEAAPVVAFLKAHVPEGYGQSGVGMLSSPAGGVQDVIDVAKVMPPNVSDDALEIGVDELELNSSLVNVVGVVQWTPLRPADERVPARDRVVIVSVVRAFEQGHPVVRRVVVTDATQVAPIVRAFNGLRVAPPGQVSNCVELSANTVSYRIAFATSPRAAPDLTATDTICSPITVAVGTGPGTSLSDYDGTFALAVAHALGMSSLHFQ